MATRHSTPSALFARLDDEGIVYCHWKSNSHLDAALEGLTDLDLLFDRTQVDAIHTIFSETGFKRFVTDRSRSHPGTEDFLGVHPENGNLVHLHVHYELHTGPRHLKNYRLPWASQILATRVKDPVSGVYTADPAQELLLLVVRAAMKVRARDRLKPLLGKNAVAADLTAEFDWLIARIGREAPVHIAAEVLGGRVSGLVASCVESRLTFNDLVRLRRALKASLRPYSIHGPLTAVLQRFGRELHWLAGSINRKWLKGPYRYARTPASGGLLVAFVGSDGSGKSTVVAKLHRWLGGKVDVMPVYLGSGKGRGSLLRWPLQQVKKTMRGRGRRPGSGVNGSTRRITTDRVVWALALAREKSRKLKRAGRAREKGLIVICDRYPQTQTDGMIDGPLLSSWLSSENTTRRVLAEWERRPYLLAESLGPDVVLRFDVPSDLARSRRSEVDAETFELRRNVVMDLRFPNARYGLISIDAARDLDSVLVDVKQTIWSLI
ncbi:MAG TPA: hypothetical protein VEB69_12635 [Acidimicrobiia bacterium]|nr:hypothetical protein [Acidimicrobiia bacterium]